MPSIAASAAISVVLRAKLKAAAETSISKCLAILCRLMTAPTANAISAAPRNGARLRSTAAWMRARSRSVAASSSSRLRRRSAARSALRQTARRSLGKAGVVMCSNVALIEQRELQCAALQQPFDRRSTQRGDPVETRRFDLIGDACLCDHTAVTDHHNAIEPEALLQLLDLR